MVGGRGLLLCLLVYIAKVDAVNFKEIEKTISKYLECKRSPGLAVSVVKNGRIVMAEGFGVKSLYSTEAVTNKTLFGILSLTKAFTSTLIVKLLQRHQRIRLNTTVAEIFGKNDIFFDNLLSTHVTIEDVLAHKVGLPAHGRIRFDTFLTRQNLVQRLKYLKPVGEFRNGFYYSDILYGLATAIGERISGKSWEKLMFKEIFEPLCMTSSNLVNTVDWSNVDLVEGYFHIDGKPVRVPRELARRWDTIGGSGGILSNAVDMAKWMLFHLNEGKNIYGQQIIDKAQLDETYKARNIRTPFPSAVNYLKPTTPVTFTTPNYALGWRRGSYRGYEFADHIGSFWGYTNVITLIPSLNIGVFSTMSGEDSNNMFPLQLYLIDTFLGKKPWLNESTLCSFPEPWARAPSPTPTADIDKNIKPGRRLSMYTGTYKNLAYGYLEVTVMEYNSLFITYGWANFQLYPSTTPDIFVGEAVGIAAHTVRNGGNQFIFKYDRYRRLISSLTIPGLESKDPPVFVKDNFTFNPISYRMFYPEYLKYTSRDWGYKTIQSSVSDLKPPTI